MFKKLFLMGALIIGLIGVCSTPVMAYPACCGDVAWCPWCSGSPMAVIITSEFLGIANTDVKPTDVYVEMMIESMELYSVNPDGHPGGEGIPFTNIPVSFTGQQSTGDQTPMTGAGKWEGEFKFYLDDILQFLIANGYITDLPELPNPNWSWKIVVHQALIRVTANTDVSNQCEDNDYDDYYSEQCTAPLSEGDDEERLLEEVVHNISRCWCTYDPETGEPMMETPGNCTRLFLWKYKNKNPICSYIIDKEAYSCEYDFPADPIEWWNNVP